MSSPALRRAVLVGWLAVFSMACEENLAIMTSMLPDASVGVAYNVQLEGTNVDRWVLFSGTLPPGIQLTNEGALSGTPRLAGVFSFTLQALKQPISAPTRTVTQGFAITVK
jgi:putative Ig domain-containing protein